MSIEAATALVLESQSQDLNEADTRFQIIDRLLLDVLGWPRGAFELEKATADGYMDFLLRRPDRSIALIIEAKRIGVHFEFPNNFNGDKDFREVRVKALLTSKSLRDAMEQVQAYAIDQGAEFAAVCNGMQFVLFKAFERGKSWKDLPAVAISNLRWFRDCYTAAINLLGYTSVTDRLSIKKHFERTGDQSRELFFSKERITSFDQVVNSNSVMQNAAKRAI